MRNRLLRFHRNLLLFLFSIGGIQLNAQTFVSAAVSQPLILSAAAGADDDICPGDSIVIGGIPAAFGGTPGYTYDWTPTGEILPTNVSNPVAFPASSTPFIVEVTDAKNCTAFDTVVITVVVCTGINDPEGQIKLSLYPNPTQGDLILRIDDINGKHPASIKIWDANAKLIHSENFGEISGNFEKQISINRLAAGNYLVNISLGEIMFSRRLTVQN